MNDDRSVDNRNKNERERAEVNDNVDTNNTDGYNRNRYYCGPMYVYVCSFSSTNAQPNQFKSSGKPTKRSNPKTASPPLSCNIGIPNLLQTDGGKVKGRRSGDTPPTARLIPTTHNRRRGLARFRCCNPLATGRPLCGTHD